MVRDLCPRKETLLPTARADVPAELANALAQLCADVGEVERGYVCAVMVEESGRETARELQFCVKVRAAVTEADDAQATLFKLFDRLPDLPVVLNEVGFGVLADRAVSAWEAKALLIYPT
jgi:hypothetical protein